MSVNWHGDAYGKVGIESTGRLIAVNIYDLKLSITTSLRYGQWIYDELTRMPHL